MWFIRRKKGQAPAPTEAEIQAVRKQTIKQIDATTKSTKKLNNLIKNSDIGITEMIFYATGGDHRKTHD